MDDIRTLVATQRKLGIHWYNMACRRELQSSTFSHNCSVVDGRMYRMTIQTLDVDKRKALMCSPAIIIQEVRAD